MPVLSKRVDDKFSRLTKEEFDTPLREIRVKVNKNGLKHSYNGVVANCYFEPLSSKSDLFVLFKLENLRCFDIEPPEV